MGRTRFFSLLFVVSLALVRANVSSAADPNPADEPDEAAPVPQATANEPADSAPKAVKKAAREPELLLPKVDVFFPEGDFDLRLGRFVKNALFEGRIRYNFVKGDVTALLRYRYYGYSRVYTLGFFDDLEFEAVEKRSNDFSRVRGGSLLVQTPFDFHRRAFLLAEVDRITSNKDELRFSTDRTNVFLRGAFQLGTPRDERSNAIVGESRARIQQLFSAYRDIGPRGTGLTTAVTWGFDELLGDFDYVKLELDALKRINLSRGLFVIHRLHGGTFFRKKLLREEPGVGLEDSYSIPRSELFRLDGRENLKGLKERRRGTENLHTTLELFMPWFEDALRPALGVEWESWYFVLYGGLGTVGFDRDIYEDWDAYVPDIGFGFESSFKLRNYTFFLAGIVAQTLRGDEGPKGKISIKSFH